MRKLIPGLAIGIGFAVGIGAETHTGDVALRKDQAARICFALTHGEEYERLQPEFINCLRTGEGGTVINTDAMLADDTTDFYLDYREKQRAKAEPVNTDTGNVYSWWAGSALALYGTLRFADARLRQHYTSQAPAPQTTSQEQMPDVEMVTPPYDWQQDPGFLATQS